MPVYLLRIIIILNSMILMIGKLQQNYHLNLMQIIAFQLRTRNILKMILSVCFVHGWKMVTEEDTLEENLDFIANALVIKERQA